MKRERLKSADIFARTLRSIMTAPKTVTELATEVGTARRRIDAIVDAMHDQGTVYVRRWAIAGTWTVEVWALQPEPFHIDDAKKPRWREPKAPRIECR
jgi:hypothetical protein